MRRRKLQHARVVLIIISIYFEWSNCACSRIAAGKLASPKTWNGTLEHLEHLEHLIFTHFSKKSFRYLASFVSFQRFVNTKVAERVQGI